MPPKTIHLITGMPRAGSTLLGNILLQNPRFHVTPTSGLIELIAGMRTNFDKISDFRTAPNEEGKVGAMRGALFGFFEAIDRPVVFDRCRNSLFDLEMIELLLRRKAKAIVCVRDLPEILVSFELLWRANKAFRTLAQQEASPVEFRTLEGRCKVWMLASQPVGRAYVAIQDALTREFQDRLHFVHFDYLTRNPAGALQDIYRFTEEPLFTHDFEQVKQQIFEDDLAHGIKGLHDIRPAVRPVPKRAKDVLGPLAEKFKGPYVWDPFIPREKK